MEFIYTIIHTYPWEVAYRRCSDTTISLGPVSHHFGVDSTRYTVVKLGIQLRQLIRLIIACLRDVSDSSGFDDVANDELLDSFVLWDTSSTVGATNWIHMAAAMLGTSTIPAFASLRDRASVK